MKITPHVDRSILPGRGKTTTKPHSDSLPVNQPSSVTPEISEQAREKVLTSTGKNAASPAQRARATLADYEKLGHLQFGKMVSALARGEAAETTSETTETTPAPTATEGTPAEPLATTTGDSEETPTL